MERIRFNYRDFCGLEEGTISQVGKALSQYQSELLSIGGKMEYGTHESSINLSFDQEMHNEINAVAQKLITSSLKYIIHVGIGGSNLGTQAIYEAYVGNLDPFLIERVPKIIFIDTVNDAKLVALQNILRVLGSSDEVAVVVVSKSGITTETVANFEIIYTLLKDRFGEVNHRIVMVTDRGSKLWVAGESEGFVLLPIPKKVGGRFSVFSAAGALSLILSGIPVDEAREGASLAREFALSSSLEENDALLSAVILFLYHEKGIHTHNNFLFDSSLEFLGKWHRQLLAESTGKDGKGILPIVSIGSTDLHSVGQFYLGGNHRAITTFVHEANEHKQTHTRIKSLPLLPELVLNIAGKSPREINDAIYQGVKEAYRKRGLPFMEITLPNLSLKTIGVYMQTKMIEVMYLAHLLGVNAFDQPNVESYKDETRDILKR